MLKSERVPEGVVTTGQGADVDEGSWNTMQDQLVDPWTSISAVMGYFNEVNIYALSSCSSFQVVER